VIADPAWKSALLHKGQDVEEMLEAILAGREVDLSSLPLLPGQDPEARVRAFLAQIERAIDLFDTDRFGRCEVCNADLDRAALAARPWLSSCPAHSGRWRS
jgi:hypothetical protein